MKLRPSVAVVVIRYCPSHRSADTARAAEVISCGFTPHPGGHGEDKVRRVMVLSTSLNGGAPNQNRYSTRTRVLPLCCNTEKLPFPDHTAFWLRLNHLGGNYAFPTFSATNNLSRHAAESMVTVLRHQERVETVKVNMVKSCVSTIQPNNCNWFKNGKLSGSVDSVHHHPRRLRSVA